jgi:hypothetical protein
MSSLDKAAQERINTALVGSSNCPFRVNAVTISNIAPDQTTQAFLSRNAQNQSRLAAVKVLLDEYKALNIPKEMQPLAEALILSGDGKELNVHIGGNR